MFITLNPLQNYKKIGKILAYLGKKQYICSDF